MFNLNRLFIFSNQGNFPKEILKAIVYTCGVSVTDQQINIKEREILNFIKKYENFINDSLDNLNEESLKKIAIYIGTSKWEKNNLIKAFKHILIFNDSLDIEDIISKEGDLKIKFKTNDNIYSCDPIMAYYYCINKNIEIFKNDSIKDIEEKIKLYISNELINKNIKEELSKVEVINLEEEIKLKEEEINLEEEEINLIKEKLKEEKLIKKFLEEKLKEGELKEEKLKEEKLLLIKEGEDLNKKLYFFEQLKHENTQLKSKINNNNNNIDIENLEKELLELKSKLDSKNNLEKELLELKSKLDSKNNLEKELLELKSKNNDIINLKYELEKKKDLEKELLELKSKNNDIINLKYELEKKKDLEKEIIDLKNKYNKEINMKLYFEEKNKRLENDNKELINSNNLNINNNLINNFLKEKNNKLINLENLENILNKFNVNFLISKTLLTNEEAIVIGLKLLSFDLRDSPNPYDDLIELNDCLINNKKFIPTNNNNNFYKILNLNHNYYYINKYYRKELKNFNNQKILNSLNEEYGVDNIEDYYNNENFHYGWMPNLNKDIFGGDNNIVISFGIPDKNIVNLTKNYFKINGLINPINKLNLEEKQIKSLNFICKKYALDILENKNLNDDETIKLFISKYLFASSLIDRVMDDIFKIGMYIRGWRLSGIAYPLRKVDCVDYISNKNKIDENINNSIKDFKYNVERINDPNIKLILKKLPLVDYINNNFIYNVKESKFIDLIDNIYNEDINSISNKLILNAYYYYKTVSGIDLANIKIENLELL
jgi:DNA repair protein SbcC/Rad50